MFRMFNSWLLTAIMVGHGLLGCCAHHVHAESPVARTPGAHVDLHAVELHDAHTRHSCGHHGTPVDDSTHDDHDVPCAPSDCDEAPCVFLRSDSGFSELTGSACFNSHFGLFLDAVLSLDEALHPTSAHADRTAGYEPLVAAISPHVRHQVWLI